MIRGYIQKEDPTSSNFLEIFLGKGKIWAWEIPVTVLAGEEVEKIKHELNRAYHESTIFGMENIKQALKILEGKE